MAHSFSVPRQQGRGGSPVPVKSSTCAVCTIRPGSTCRTFGSSLKNSSQSGSMVNTNGGEPGGSQAGSPGGSQAGSVAERRSQLIRCGAGQKPTGSEIEVISTSSTTMDGLEVSGGLAADASVIRPKMAMMKKTKNFFIKKSES